MPWRNLGATLTADAPIEVWTREAGMAWLVKRSRVRFGDGDDKHVVPEHHVLFRSDTKEPLGVVGARFKIVQPPEILELFRELVNLRGYQLHTAGTLFNGRKYWALASIGESAAILRADDVVAGYLWLMTSCDGSTSTVAKFVVLRESSQTMLSISEEIAITHRTQFDPERVKSALEVGHARFAEFVSNARRLALIALGDEDVARLTEQVLVESGTVTKAEVRESRAFKQIVSLFDDGPGNHGESAWDWVQAVAIWVDHEQRAKSDSHRLSNSWHGRGDALKSRALNMALEYV